MISLPLLFSLILSPLTGMAVDAIFVNNGTINFPTNVDATTVVNKGTWIANTVITPFETADTLNYTNTGSISASPGWNFDFNPSGSGQRGWSSVFFNDNYNPNLNLGVIQALDGPIVNPINSQTISSVSYLLVSATNIINKGLLAASANGEIILNGSEVNLSRSELEITPLVGTGSPNGPTNFTSDAAIYDEFWSPATNGVLTVNGSPWNGTMVSRFTFFGVQEPCGTTATIPIGPITPQLADSLETFSGTNIITATNMDLVTTTDYTVYSNDVRQAIFVLVADTNIIVADRFGQKLSSTNLFNPRAVQFTTVSTNLVTGTLQTNFIYLIDTLGSSTNLGLLRNTFISPSANCTSPTFRPATVSVARLDDGTFSGGSTGMGSPPPIFFYDPNTFSNSVAQGVSDVYSALVDNLAAEPPLGDSITNVPGKIHIYAKDLDLTRTRMSAESEILIQATNLIGSAGAVMDCQNLSYNLGSTNGSLNVTNLAVQTVQRLSGTITEHSDLWTNYYMTVIPNFVTNSTAGGSMPANVTNVTEVDIAITVVDASGLTTIQPVTVQDLVLHSTNMVVSDSMNVANSLLFDGQSLTIQGGLNLAGQVQNWNSATAPTLRFFTNNGSLNILNNAHFGDDGATNYAAFVNHGFIFSAGQTINSDYLEINGGTDRATAANFTAFCRTGLVMNAAITAAGDIQFFANNLQIDPSTLSAGGAIDFTVTNSLFDAGFATSNIFACSNGFNLFIKPATGDLLGTSIIDTALDQDEVGHVWAGHDFGTNVAGYLNNVAIGTLILNQDSTNGFFTPLFHFSGASAVNGLYVSNLDLSTLTDYADEIEIDNNLVIYFVSAELNPSVNISPAPDAEHFLDGKFGGHLRWVQGVTSLSSANAKISGAMLANGQFQLSFTGSGSPSQTNVVEASTNLVNWVPIYTNLGPLIFTDAAANSYPYRFYRVESSP